jgi:hypothetical protein
MKTAFCLLIIILCPCQFRAISQVDPNQQYIDRKVKQLKYLREFDFCDGFILKQGVQYKTKIYLKRKNISKDMYLFIIVSDTAGNQTILSPKDIDAYSVNGNEFIKYTASKDKVVSCFFIRLVEKGKITLYEKEPTPNDYEFAYYLFPRGNKLLYITPFTGNIQDMYKEGNLLASSDHLMETKTNRNDEKFKMSFSKLVSDCPELVNKILSGFYGINDIRKIIKEYNSWIN